MSSRSLALAAALVVGWGAPRSTAGGEATGSSPAGGASVAVTVGDTPIFRSEVDAAVKRVAQGRLLDPERERRLMAETVEQLVDERLLRREVEARQISVDEDEVTEIITRMRGQLADRQIAIETFLAQSGRDETSLRNQIRLEIALNKLLLPQLTSNSLEAAFTKHRRDLDGTLVRASHIVLRPDPGRGAAALAELERRAAQVRTDILQGTISFADAALKHSAGPSRRQGGDIGYFPRHGAMDEEFARQTFALAKGEISKPFVTPFGVHLVRVTDLKPGDARPETLRPQLEKLVVQDAIREIVARGRRTIPIDYAPGIPHFAADDDGTSPERRAIVTEPAP
ncbi:MAG: peptidylprolyl isomerase [Planctomycetia bacterium]